MDLKPKNTLKMLQSKEWEIFPRDAILLLYYYRPWIICNHFTSYWMVLWTVHLRSSFCEWWRRPRKQPKLEINTYLWWAFIHSFILSWTFWSQRRPKRIKIFFVCGLAGTRVGICHSRHSRRECKNFASGVNFSRNNAIYNRNESTKYILYWFHL